MEIILRKTVEGLGNEGSVLKVADGYARNYLIPKQLAVFATEKNRRLLEHERRVLAVQHIKGKREAEILATRIADTTCTIQRRAGESDRLFGSVTTMDLSEALSAQSIEIDRRQIELDAPIRDLGVFMVSIRLHADVVANLQVFVVREA
jgi:large subunit ribosomal protein L9